MDWNWGGGGNGCDLVCCGDALGLSVVMKDDEVVGKRDCLDCV